MKKETKQFTIEIILSVLYVLLVAVILFNLTKSANNANASEVSKHFEEAEEIFVRDTLVDFGYAFAQVESSDNPKAYNKSSGATGWLQMKPIMVDEANRCRNIIEGTKDEKYYGYDDRWDKEKSLEMFIVVMTIRNPEKSLSKACTIWNYKDGKPYEDKVRKNYAKVLEGEIPTQSPKCVIV